MWKRNEMKLRMKEKSLGYLIIVEKKWVTKVVGTAYLQHVFSEHLEQVCVG